MQKQDLLAALQRGMAPVWASLTTGWQALRMAKQKRKLTRAEKAAKARRKAEFMTIFVNGRQKRVRRPVLIDGMHPDEFIRINADPIWLHQNEMWEDIAHVAEHGTESREDDEVPF